MQTHIAQPLILIPLSLQIKSLGGEGYNCDVQSEQVQDSYSVIHTFDTPTGKCQLKTLNEYSLGIIADTLNHSVYYNGDTGEYTLRTPSEVGYAEEKTVKVEPIGMSYEEAFAELQRRWPKRIVWNLQPPTKSLKSVADKAA